MIFCNFYFIIVLLINSCSSGRIGERKRWLPNLDWDNEKNWLNNEIPKLNSKISFPIDMLHSVSLPSSLEICEIQLPKDGSLLLPRNGQIKLNDIKEDDKTFTWKLKGPYFWVDPDNWGTSSKAVPHLERIPCSLDTVVLPDHNHSLSIRLPNNNVEVMEIKIGNGENIDEWSWQSLMHGREFQKSRTSVRLSGLHACEKGCLCKLENTDELLDEVCNIQRSRCEKSACSYPLQVEGHCCDYCGGKLILHMSDTIVPTMMILTDQALSSYKESVSWHVRSTLDGNQEILIMEKETYSQIITEEALDKLARFLAARGIHTIDIIMAGAPLTGSNLFAILGPLFLVPILIFILIMIAIPYYGYSYRDIILVWREACGSIRDGIHPKYEESKASGSSFGFARFENVAEGDVQLAGDVILPQNVINEIEDNTHEDNGKRFINPLYRSKRKPATSTTTTATTEITSNEGEKNILDINSPVSLNILQDQVFHSDESNIESD